MKNLADFFRKAEIFDGDISLTHTVPISEHSELIIPSLEQLYNSTSTPQRHLATVINSIFCHRRKVFTITKKQISHLVSSDPNVKFKTMDTKSYKRFLRHVFVFEIFEQLREPTRNKAGVYKVRLSLLNDCLDQIAGKAFFDEQERQVLSWYDNSDIVEKISEKERNEYKKLIDECREDVKKGRVNTYR